MAIIFSLTLPPSDFLSNNPNLFSAPHQWFLKSSVTEEGLTDSRTGRTHTHIVSFIVLDKRDNTCVRPVREFVCHTWLQKSLMRSWEEVGVVCKAVTWGKGKKKILSNTIKETIRVCVRSVSSFVLRCVTLDFKNHWWGAEKR